jgi:hypothetical protein
MLAATLVFRYFAAFENNIQAKALRIIFLNLNSLVITAYI